MKFFEYAAAIAMLLTIPCWAAAQDADSSQGVIVSPDGRYQQCMDRREYNRLSARMNMPAISVWSSKALSNGKPVSVRSFLSVSTAPPNRNGREWSLWIGWDEDLAANGNSPRLVCIQGGGQGVILLDAGSALPAQPFGRTIPKGGRWQTNPNLTSAQGSRMLGKKVTEWESCHTFARLAKELSKHPDSVPLADCESYGVSGLDALLRAEGFSPRFIMRSDSSTAKMLIAYYNKVSALRLVYVADSGIAKITDAADAQLSEPLFATLKAAKP